ncbi:polynucleotide 5'-hydroxyl-kinase NOL9-like isoform X2 [Antedon mediterranea]|uniref:polynucleotide 5'-hydroxyl-kinase NOL9-like isoform X2 n=1 Tax=Antedon mediterranea TaxID=105859 RepID=UPI003AF90E1F
MSSKTRDGFSINILHKTKNKIIKKGKEKKVKEKKVKSIADSLNLKRTPIPKKCDPSKSNGSTHLSTKGQGKSDKIRNKTVKQKKSKKKEKTVKTIAQTVKSVFKTKKDKNVKKKNKLHKNKKDFNQNVKKVPKVNNNYVSAIGEKVCVVEGFKQKSADNSWIDVSHIEGDDGSDGDLEIPSVSLGDGDLKIDYANCFKSDVGVVDLAATNLRLKPSRKKIKKITKKKLRSNDDEHLSSDILHVGPLKFTSGTLPSLLTSTPIEKWGFFNEDMETSVITHKEVPSTEQSHKSCSLKRKVVADSQLQNKSKSAKPNVTSVLVKYKLYRLEDSSQCLAVLSFGAVFAFYGKAFIKVMYGGANILGYEMTNVDDYIPVFCPQSHSAITITTGQSDLDNDKLENILNRIQFTDNSVRLDIKDQMSAGDCCLLSIVKMTSGLSWYLTSFSDFKDLFDTKLPKTHLRTSNIEIAFSVGLELIVSEKDFKNTMQPSSQYDSVCDVVSVSLTELTPVVLVCGKKNVGKSTFCRYLINSMLNKCGNVMYLECDIGQTEFSSPGFVSLTQVSQPIVGPPFTHHMKSKRKCYFGGVSVNDSPDRYVACIKYILSHYKQCYSEVPLVINTMGWIQDLGLMLLIDTVRLSNPTHIVQFTLPVQTTPPPLDTKYLSSAEGWDTGVCLEAQGVGLELESDGVDSEIEGSEPEIEYQESHGVEKAGLKNKAISFQSEGLTHNAQLLEINVLMEHPTNQKYKNSEIRTLALLSSLFDLQPNPLPEKPIPLTAMVPMVLPWTQVAIHIPHFQVPKSELMSKTI